MQLSPPRTRNSPRLAHDFRQVPFSEVDCTQFVRKHGRVQRTVDHQLIRSRVHQTASCSRVVCTIAGGDVAVDGHWG